MSPIVAAVRRSRGYEHPARQGALPISNVGIALGVVCGFAGAAGSALLNHPAPGITGLLIGIYLMFAVKVADQWEKAAVLRLGRYRGLRGPGPFVIVPIIDTVSRFVDQRVRVTDVTAEAALTRDTVPVNVDASCSGWCGTRRNASSRWRTFSTRSR